MSKDEAVAPVGAAHKEGTTMRTIVKVAAVCATLALTRPAYAQTFYHYGPSGEYQGSTRFEPSTGTFQDYGSAGQFGGSAQCADETCTMYSPNGAYEGTIQEGD